MSRSYGQYCGLARALDLVGDRWTLLVVRELLLGPARYRDLQHGLPGVATNLLSDRLRDLEAAGIVERRPAADSNAVVYALTEWGAELRGPIEGLVRWSTPLMVSGPGTDAFHPEWLPVPLLALLRARATGSPAATVGVIVDQQTFQVSVDDSGLDIRAHDGRELDATVEAEPMIILGLAAGLLDLDSIRSMVALTGDESAVRQAFGLTAPRR
ncbi:winged helix-turn-helix transcriptional regulator [Tsukamurella soli]|uniref:Winged helix-turn-helix transcriptional regulator n=1 Tax=Tsukamurella soli TaxID=644556 RepID=A0ABP8JQE2_9ACTN